MNKVYKCIGVIALSISLSTGCEMREVPPVKKHTAWCVKICMEDILEDLHNNGKSWGTGSSSLSGVKQNNFLADTRDYCESIYKDACYSVIYSSESVIHNSGFKSASVNKEK